jgi:hypothetical protein
MDTNFNVRWVMRLVSYCNGCVSENMRHACTTMRRDVCDGPLSLMFNPGIYVDELRLRVVWPTHKLEVGIKVINPIKTKIN